MAVASKLLILGWHNVEDSWHFPKRRVMAARGLAAQLAVLRRVGTVVPLEAAFDRLTRGQPLPRRAVALTFDDGYGDALGVVAPLLLRHRLPATFFLCPGFLSRSEAPAWEIVSWAVRSAQSKTMDWRGRTYALGSEAQRRRLGRQITEDLKRNDTSRRRAAVADVVAACRPRGQPGVDGMLLDWAGAARLAGLGFAIGSHTVSHPILSQESRSAQRDEIFRARDEFGRRLGIEPATFAYPNGGSGDFTDVTADILRHSGHAVAVTTVRGFNGALADPFTARRFVIDPEQGPVAFLHLLREAQSAHVPLTRSGESGR